MCLLANERIQLKNNLHFFFKKICYIEEKKTFKFTSLSALRFQSRPEHFNVDPKNRTGTNPKISGSKKNIKFINIFWIQNYFTQNNRNKKKPTQINPNPIRTDPNRPDSIKTYLYRLKNLYIQTYDFLCSIL